jgi:hypothetical protein
VNQNKIPEAWHVVMNEMVFASGMESTALMNDFNTKIHYANTIHQDESIAPKLPMAGIMPSA